MSVPSVFLSSVIVDFEDVRDAAAAAIRGVGMHATRSEELGADASAPRRALLDEVAGSDLYLLLLGARYGDYTAAQSSPTEDEYREAGRLHKPILVVVQDTELEPRQQQFLDEIRGGWGEGVLYGKFAGAGDAGAAVAAALSRYQSGIVEDGPAAQQRALVLAAGEDRQGSGSGVSARVAFVPLRQVTLLDALALDNPSLGDDLAAALRSGGAVPQQVGIEARVSAAGIRLEGTGAENWTTPAATVDVDGAITILGSAALEGTFGFSLVDPVRLQALVTRAGAAAQLIWNRIDTRDEVGQVAITVAVLDAQYKGYGASSTSSTSVGMGAPATVLAPQPPEIVARGQLTDELLARRIEAAIKRVFADAGALQQ